MQSTAWGRAVVMTVLTYAPERESIRKTLRHTFSDRPQGWIGVYENNTFGLNIRMDNWGVVRMTRTP